MRYAKGSIQLSQAHDYPLLRQVLRSGFVTHDQLYCLMHLSHHEFNRHSFTWRLRRLVKHSFVVRQSMPRVAGGQFVYYIGDNGTTLLNPPTAQAQCSTRSRNRSKWARPYIWRLMVFSRLMQPSTGPLLHGSCSAASTAA